MPDYRKLHNGHGNSEKLSLITDFEFRVWLQYRASADDFGVCLMSAAKLQGDNRRLEREPLGKVLNALKRLIEVGLMVPFEHQGQTYLCQLDWQDFEETQYPRKSLQPVPPLEVFQILSEETQNLFETGKRVSAEFLGFARACARKTQTLTQTQTETEPRIEGEGVGEGPAAPADVWARIIDAFDGSDQTKQIWFKPCRQLAEYPDRVVVGTPTELHQEWISRHYTNGLAAAAASVAPGKRVTFERIGAVKSRKAS
jgi:hypothetical protein